MIPDDSLGTNPKSSLMSAALNFFLATRPAFLTITLLGCFIGITFPSSTKGSLAINLLAVVLAISVHAAANLINDFYDHLNGSDLNNHNRISPFTGGSRFIQNQLLKPAQIYQLGVVLFILSAAIGFYICLKTSWLLVPLGIIGIVIAWAYSAPPLQLMSKGILGEISIALSWSLVVIGFASMQTTNITYQAIPVGLAYGVMVSNILLVNQIPDIKADRLAKKLTLATKTSGQALSAWYIAGIITAYGLQMIGIYYFDTPRETLLSALPLPAFLYCTKVIAEVKNDKKQIKQLITLNLGSAHLYSILLVVGLLLN